MWWRVSSPDVVVAVLIRAGQAMDMVRRKRNVVEDDSQAWVRGSGDDQQVLAGVPAAAVCGFWG